MRHFGVVLVFLALTACGSEPVEKIEDVRQSVRSATIKDGRVAIAMIAGGNGPATNMASIAHDLFAIAEWQMTYGGGVEKGLTALVTVKTQDKYGNPGEKDAFIISFLGTDLKQMKWENITHWDLMNFANFMPLHRFGTELATAWCNDADNFRYSKAFCAKISM